jgi:hypothetical protein
MISEVAVKMMVLKISIYPDGDERTMRMDKFRDLPNMWQPFLKLPSRANQPQVSNLPQQSPGRVCKNSR